MRLTFFLLTAVFVQTYASSNAQNISITGQNLSLKQVFEEVRKQTGYGLFAKKDLLEDAKNVNVSVSNKPLKEFLDIVFKDQPLNYTIQGKNIILSRKLLLFPEKTDKFKPIKITVTDSAGIPLSGASISLQSGKSLGATNTDGTAVVEVNEGDVLLVTFVGFETKTITVSKSMLNGAALTIMLQTSNEQLKDIEVVVNTGYQSISRERSAGSFSKPNKEILHNRSTSMNIIERLEGLVPGLTINNGPGGGGILIRGLTSINASRNPLIVVDGIPVSDINSVNPQDVADVTVLKDATAASIYGARASNGVIVITTKKGSSSERLKVVYDGFISFQGKPDLSYQPVLNSQQYIQAAKEVFDPITFPWNNASTSTNAFSSVGVPPHEMILYNQYRGLISQAQANKSLDSLAAINNLGQIEDLWYRSASLMNHTVSLSGGGRVHSFYGSLAFTDNRSDRPGAKNQTYKINLRQDFNLAKFLKAYLITDLTNTVGSSPRQVSVTGNFYPYQLFKDADGNSLSMPYVGPFADSMRNAVAARSRIGMDYKPLDDANLLSSKSNSLLNRITGGVAVNLLKGLRYEGVYGYIRGHVKNTMYDDNTSFVQRNELVQFTVAANPTITPLYYLPVAGGKFFTSNGIQRNWTVRNQLVFDRSFHDGQLQLTALVGQEAQEQLLTTNEGTVRGYSQQLRNGIAVDYAALALGVMNPVAMNNIGKSVLPSDFYVERETQTRFTSLYANTAYTFARKYSLNASWRVDKSNLFGIEKGVQGRPAYSIGAKWMIGDEKFAEGLTFINRLAVRATYGITGNAPEPGTASSYNILSSSVSASLPGGRNYSIATPANPDLSWESTETINFGIDFSLLDSRISGSLDYYRKKTEGLIGQLGVNSLTGYTSIVGNYGNMKNNGIEASVTSTNIRTRNFSWTTTLNIAYNKNKITELKLVTPVTTGQQLIDQTFFPGYSAFALFAYQYAGLDAMGDPMIYLADKSSTKARNVSLPEDVRYIGTTQPLVSGGLSNYFTYKGFSLGFNAIFNLGHKMRRDVGNYFTGRLIAGNPLALRAGAYTSAINLNQGNINAIFNERWRQPGDEHITNVPSYVSNTSESTARRDINYFLNGDLNVLDASYIKMRDITLSYSLPEQWIQSVKATGITLRMQMSNLMIWKANKHGIDPEFGGGVRNMQGIFTVGANVSF